MNETRKFGLVALIFFGALFGIGVWRHREFAECLFGVLAFLGLLFICLPAPMAPVHRVWLKVAHWIGQAITTVILTIAYYVAIVPFALLKRVFGGRPLPLRPDKDAKSYWVARTEPAQPVERFAKRY
jgi:hypothetical protein